MSFPEKPPAIPPEGLATYLVKLTHQEKYSSLVEKINTEYHYWTKVKYLADQDPDVLPEALWYLTLFRRMLTSKSLSFKDGDFKISLTFNLPALFIQKLHYLDMNLGGRLLTNSPFHQSDQLSYQMSSLMEEAIASSQIEGAATTRVKAKEILRKNLKPKNKSERMIVNNFKSILFITSIKSQPFSIDKVLELHRSMTEDTLDDKEYEGKFRITNDIHVLDFTTSEVAHTPPDYMHVPELMNDLVIFANDNSAGSFIHPIVKAAIIHFMIGYIHPFVDGNGRTARAIFYWYLLSKGYWLMEYLSISRIIYRAKTQYANAFLFTEYDRNDVSYFIKYTLESLSSATDALHSYIKRKAGERKKLHSIQKIPNLNDRQVEIVHQLINDSERTYSISEVMRSNNVVYQTARTDLLVLEKLGVLDKVIKGRTMLFSRSANFDTILANLLSSQ